jgi:hypothetical protein
VGNINGEGANCFGFVSVELFQYIIISGTNQGNVGDVGENDENSPGEVFAARRRTKQANQLQRLQCGVYWCGRRCQTYKSRKCFQKMQLKELSVGTE